ncbi:MAG: UDP-N-acetylmuramyl-tripeptide synthetase [Patescibacteria group bacterium]|nr:UDP-N-acetylmuramyl-tripeptide synthetase [Patescibacteria group bacterium]
MLAKIKSLIPISIFRRLQPVYHFLTGYLAALYYRFPSRQLLIIGVTGTTGKTSSVYFLSRLLSANGYKSGYTSTAQFNDGDREWLNDKKMTMPGRFFLQRTLRRMVNNGCKAAVVETTSQGIEQFRHRFINYDLLIFTNLYPEHIDAHGSFENYKRAKGKLFAHLSRCGSKYLDDDNKVVSSPSGLRQTELLKVKKTIIVNGDDDQAPYFLSFPAERKCVYTLKPDLAVAHLTDDSGQEIQPQPEFFRYEPLFSEASGSDFQFNGKRFHLSILGSYHVFNAVAALTAASALNIDAEQSASALANIKSLAGKMERIEAGQNFQVLIDYAFEPKALEALYQNLDFIPHRRLIHILGSAGGGRDQARRPILGRMAGEKADIVIVTDEDPYDDNPWDIINQVAAGAEKAGKVSESNLYKVLDRREAMRLAFRLAGADDLVLITGKGAEQYICGPKGSQTPWDDRIVAREELAHH